MLARAPDSSKAALLACAPVLYSAFKFFAWFPFQATQDEHLTYDGFLRAVIFLTDRGENIFDSWSGPRIGPIVMELTRSRTEYLSDAITFRSIASTFQATDEKLRAIAMIEDIIDVMVELQPTRNEKTRILCREGAPQSDCRAIHHSFQIWTTILHFSTETKTIWMRTLYLDISCSHCQLFFLTSSRAPQSLMKT